MRRCEACQTQIEIRFSSQSVGGIEAEIADEWLAGGLFQSLENAGTANENRALKADQEIHDAALTRFQDARAGYPNLNPRSLHPLDRRAQAVKIQIIQSDAIGLGRDCCLELFRIAD